MRKINDLLVILLIIVLSIPSLLPILQSGYFTMHDDTQPTRIFELVQSLTSGHFPVRWVADLGYGFGYPLFNFYAPLPYYVGGLFHLLGFDTITSTKLMFTVGILLSAITMYFILKEISNRLYAVVGALLYLYAPYHAVNIYIRGAVGEYYVYGLIPLYILGIIKILKNSKSNLNFKYLILTSLSLTAIILSHNIMGLITIYLTVCLIIILLIYTLLSRIKPATVKIFILSFIFSLGLSAFFTVPAVFENKFTKVNRVIREEENYKMHFVYLDQLWNSPWGFAGSSPGRDDGMSFRIGKLFLLLGAFSLAVYLIRRRDKNIKKIHRYLVITFSIIFILSIFFMHQYSAFLWEIIPGLKYVQFPWRFLNLTILSLVIITIVPFLVLKNYIRYVLAVLIILLTLIYHVKLFRPQQIYPVNPDNYTKAENIRFTISNRSDEYLSKNFHIPKNITEAATQNLEPTQNLQIISSNELPTEKIYTVDTKSRISVITKINYFPGWTYYLDNRKNPILEKDGRVSITIPQGIHDIVLQLEDTPVRKAANTVSLLTLFLLVYVSLIWKRKSYGEKSQS